MSVRGIPNVLLVTIAAIAIVAAACAGGRSASEEQTRAAASPTPPVLTPIPQQLTFSGGRVQGALELGTGECRTSESRALFQVTIIGDVAGDHHSIRVVAQSYDGPGTYGPDAPRRATVRLDGGAGSGGTLVVNDDATSGTIDAELIDNQRVSGSWSCTVVPD
jgi:hypothetical protein